MKKVSVVIEGFDLDECLNSVFNQTLKDVEIIVIDKKDEEFQEMINNYKEKITIVKNFDIKKTNGEYIIFLDGNTVLKEKMLEDYYNYVKQYDIDVLMGNYYKIKKGKEILFEIPNFKIGNVKTTPQIIYFTNYEKENKFYKRQLLLDIIDDKTIDDMFLVSKALLNSKLIGKINTPYYVVYKNKEDIIDNNIFNTLKMILDYYKREFYLRDEINYVIINKIKTLTSISKDKQFISECYDFLDKNIKEWKNNKYYKKQNFFTKIFKI